MNKKLASKPILMLAVAGLMIAQTSFAGGKAEQEVRQAATQFYSALNTLFTGDMGAMKDVWSHASDVTYMGPDGEFQAGWEQVLKNWEEQAAIKLSRKVEPTALRITVGQDLAFVSDIEKSEYTDAAGKVAKFFIRATNLFRKESGSWKMIGYHTDLLPYVSK